MDKDEAIQKLSELCQELMDIISSLKDENSFLTDTIVNANLGKITEERRTLQLQMSRMEEDARKISKEANAAKIEYEQKIRKVNSLLKDIKFKQDNINTCINFTFL